jgi:hypothetical protein
VFEQFDFKISRFSLDIFYFAERSQLDVQMPADLDQFRGDNSHGTIIGGKGLVQLGHHPTNGS